MELVGGAVAALVAAALLVLTPVSLRGRAFLTVRCTQASGSVHFILDVSG
jgi:hypothetical protein